MGNPLTESCVNHLCQGTSQCYKALSFLKGYFLYSLLSAIVPSVPPHRNPLDWRMWALCATLFGLVMGKSLLALSGVFVRVICEPTKFSHYLCISLRLSHCGQADWPYITLWAKDRITHSSSIWSILVLCLLGIYSITAHSKGPIGLCKS